MALIGTISGSNGTSTTAISGSLVIANAPASSFPQLQGGVKFLVSGSKNAERTDNPEFLFDVDVFHSGAIGSNQFMQFKPVSTLEIPTNTTASYIYTSGSTNDLYFTQYQPGTGNTNTTRFRWLESAMGTGLLHGGVLSTENGTTTFSVSSGSGIIITQNASLNTDPYPTIANPEWSSLVSQSLTYAATDQITYISVDGSGIINQSPNPLTISQKESSIYLGRILHQAGGVTNGTITEPAISYGLGESNFNFQRAFGPLKISGHVLAVSQSAGVGTLGLTKTAGDSYVEGRNYTLNPNSPNLVLAANDAALTDCKIYREYTDVAGDPVILTNGGAGYTVIDPTQYNNGGTLAVVNNNEWSNQRVFWYPRSVNRALYVYYGPQKYATFNEAVGGLSTETFTEGANTLGSAVFVGVITVKANETTLGAADARITQGPLHRGAGFGGGGGGSTSPGGSSTYVQFNNAGAFGGDANFRFDTSTGTSSVANLLVTGSVNSLTTSGTLRVKDGTGAIVGSISTSGVISGSSDLRVGGNITGSNLQLTGDIAVLGGDVTTTSTTFNIGNTTPTTVNIANNASNLYLGKSGANRVVVQGNLLLNGNEIQASGGATGLTFPSGNPSAQFAANLTVVGDLAVNGGDITTTAASFNLLTGSATTVAFASTATSLKIASGSGTNVEIGSTTGRTIVYNDLAIGTGTIIGAPGSGANVMTLVSSGNIIAKIDTDNSATGHRFAVQDYRNIDQFSIGENGNAEVSGSLFVTGSLTTSGTLKSVFAGGDEGGEIFLTKPVTNTFISGTGITIDVWQNKIRIFEEGSPNKGGFWNIGDLASSVGTNLRTAGGSQYTYRSISSNDTMTSVDSIIGCNHSTAITVKLPLASDCGAGQFFIIKDESGAAATYNIVVSKSLGSSDTIDGKDAYTLNTNSAAITLYRGGTGKFFIT